MGLYKKCVFERKLRNFSQIYLLQLVEKLIVIQPRSLYWLR